MAAVAAPAQIALPPSGIINRVSGNGLQGYSGDDGPALNASFGWLTGITVDAAGNLFVLDGSRIREIASSTGVVKTVATIEGASALAVDASGNLFVSSQTVIRKVTMPEGTVAVIAGLPGVAGYSGDGGPALQAEINGASKIATDAVGNIYFADHSNHRIRKIDAFTGQISTIAGTGDPGFSGDGGLANAAQLNSPDDVVIDASGNIFIEDVGNYRIREIVAGSGVIKTIAGTGAFGFSGDGSSATAAKFGQLHGIAVDQEGNLYLADYNNNRVREIITSTGIISTVAGNGTAGSTGDEGPAVSAELSTICGIAVDRSGYLYILNSGSGATRAVGPGSAQSPSSLSVTLTSSDPKPRMGEYVTLTAKVMTNLGVPAHSGTVTWYKGSTQIGRGDVDAAGTATLETQLADAGDLTIMARYAGDLSGYGTLSIPVYGYALTANPSGPLTVAAGQTGQFTIDVNAFHSFTGPVDLSCEGLPGPGYCSLSMTSVNLSENAATQEVTLWVHTQNPATATAGLSHGSSLLFVALCPLGLFFIGDKRRRANLHIFVLGIVMLSLSGAISGCGNSNAQLATSTTSSSSGNSLPVGTYAFNVNATSRYDSVKLPVTLIVK